MNKTLDIIAKILSVVFYPLFIPTYGVALFCYSYHTVVRELPIVWMVVAVMSTFFITAVIPITAIWIRIFRGAVSDIQIEKAQERTVPFLYSIFCFSVWCYTMISKLNVPTFLTYVTIGATVAIILVMIINLFWKISAHMTGMGGLFGGLITYCLGIGAVPTIGTLCLWIGVILLVMYARLRLNAHTPAQVMTGWLLGVACTALPYCIYCYVA